MSDNENKTLPSADATKDTPVAMNRNMLILVGAAIAILCALVAGFFFYLKQPAQSSGEQSAPITFKNKQEFVNAVAEAFDEIVAQRHKQEAQIKLQNYALAPAEPTERNIYGNTQARFSLVEFSDLECPYCKRLHPTPKAIVEGSKGNVNWEWMHLPLDFHNPVARTEAIAAECAGSIGGNRTFWAYIHEVFEQSQGGGRALPDLHGIAASLAVDKDAFATCLAEERFAAKVDEQTRRAATLGISGTPATFVVDNLTGKQELISGARPVQAILAVIAKLKAESEEADPAIAQDPNAAPAAPQAQ
ncbi:DsbA family protein [Comamonas jiangduensis]|uniref:DsbA family protein n=1 Tax=Comamonas jiangduensis TaxID=1194168 RepID=UPI003BF7EB70